MFPDDNFLNEDVIPLFLYKPTFPVRLRTEELKDSEFSYLVVVIRTTSKKTKEKVTGINFMYWGIGKEEDVYDSKQMAFTSSERDKRNHFMTAPLRAFKKHEIDILKLEGVPLSLEKLQKYTDIWNNK